MLGGGMRQAGILAAGALHAIEHHRARLTEDHANAAFLAAELARVPGLAVDATGVHTNIVMVDVSGDGPEAPMLPNLGDARELARLAGERGLLFYAMTQRRLRLVTHFDVDRAACTLAVQILAELMAPARTRRAAQG
jgi:threonine aldolase